MRARAKKDIIVASCNCYKKMGELRGPRLRKDRRIKQGQEFEIDSFFMSTGFATHGEDCLRLQGEGRVIMCVYERDFEIG